METGIYFYQLQNAIIFVRRWKPDMASVSRDGIEKKKRKTHKCNGNSMYVATKKWEKSVNDQICTSLSNILDK